MSGHVLVLGATGAVGQLFCSAALEAEYKITIYARNPAKMPETISGHPNVTMIEGELDNPSALQKAAECGATSFVSFAGPVANNKGTPVTDALKILLPLLVQNHFTRALVLSTASYVAPEDKGGWVWSALVLLIKVIGGSAYQEVTGVGAITASQPLDKLKWTVVRVGFLTNGPEAPVTATFTGSGSDRLSISRRSLASWMLQEITAEKWVGRAPYVSN